MSLLRTLALAVLALVLLSPIVPAAASRLTVSPDDVNSAPPRPDLANKTSSTPTPTPKPTKKPKSARQRQATATPTPSPTLTPTPTGTLPTATPTLTPTATPVQWTESGKSRKGVTKKSPAKKPTPEGQKRQDNEVTAGRGTLDTIGTLTRGQTVEIKGTAKSGGQVCALQMYYADKAAPAIRDVKPDAKKRCVFTVTVPDRPTAVGEGKAKLILTKETSGKKAAEASQTFTVN
ncbi:MAG: hypothetical protein U0893_05255 [Chloroflexota bacterium]